jgi:cell division septation protein DedD
MVARFRGEGFTAFSQAVDVPERGLWHRVYINGYPNRDEARSALAALDAKRFKDAFVRSLPAGVAAARAAAGPPIPAAVPAPTAPAAEPDAATAVAPPSAERPAVNYPYAYQVKSYREKAQAYQLGLELTAQGYTAFLGVSRLGDTGYWQRVYVGCFRTPEEAEKLRDDLLRDGFADAFLTYLEFGIEVAALANDPNGDALENRLLGAGFLPYHLPRPEGGEAPVVMVGGFRAQDDAQTAIEALSAAGFEGRLVMR